MVTAYSFYALTLGCLLLTTQQGSLAQSHSLDPEAGAVALKFWKAVKGGDGRPTEVVAADAKMEIYMLGGSYDREAMVQLGKHCDLSSLSGASAKKADDPTKYLWAVLRCEDNGTANVLPLGLGIRDGKIVDINIDLTTPVKETARSNGKGR